MEDDNEEKFNIQLITTYFEQLINRIEIDYQILFFYLSKESNEVFRSEEIKRLNETRLKLINEIRTVQSHNVNKYTGCCGSASLDELKSRIFLKYSFYLDYYTLKNYTYHQNQFGLLIITDYYISDNEINSLKYIFLCFDFLSLNFIKYF